MSKTSAFLGAIAMMGLLGGCPQQAVDDGSAAELPDFSAARFSNPVQIDNPYLPLMAGDRRVYQSESADGLEVTTVEVLSETREVAGVLCRVVRDTVTLDGVVIEDTFDWFAQDDAGNVWYMGEDVDNYNYDDAGVLIDVTHEGSWEAGLDVAGVGAAAQPGIQMLADPAAGDAYYQEFYPGEAEDEASVVDRTASVVLAGGARFTALQTRDATALDAAAVEHKFYVIGVGLVLEENLTDGSRTELIEGIP